MWREEAVAVVKLREDGVGPTPQRTERHSAASSKCFVSFWRITQSPHERHIWHRRLRGFFLVFFLTIFTSFCSGPHSSGAAVGGGERSNWCRGSSAEAASAQHRPAAAHRPSGQTDPRTGAESSQPADIQWVPSFSQNNSPFFSLSLISSSAEIGGKSSFLPSSLKLFIIFSLHLLHVVTPPTLIKSWHPINYPVAALSEESPLLLPPSGNLLLLLYMISVTSPLMLHHDNHVLSLFCLPKPMRGCLFHLALCPTEMNPLQSTIHTV